MNSRIFIIAGVITSIVVATTAYSAVSAQSNQSSQSNQSTLSDTHIQRIQQNCKLATRVIQQIHANDGPLRVNRGQVYDSILSKLMTPLNSRLIANKLDASTLVRTAAQYDKAMSNFRDNYRKYDNQMSEVLTIDCIKEPVKFYDELGQARYLRSVVHSDVMKINGLVDEYHVNFSAFREKFTSGEMREEL